MRSARRWLVSAALVALGIAPLSLQTAAAAGAVRTTHSFATDRGLLAPDQAPLVTFDSLRLTLTPDQLQAGPPPARLTDNPEAVSAAKRDTARRGAPAPATVQPAGPPVAAVNQPGLQAGDELGCCTPPDTTGAIGPLHYLETVNSLVAVYGRTALAEIARANLNAFVGAPGTNTFDPQIMWDNVGGRWYYAADVGNSALALGWSKTADPADLLNGWCHLFIDTGTSFHDFPKLGGDDNYFFIGTNVFAPAFVTSTIWAIPKPAAGNAVCPTSGTAYFFGSAASPLLNPDSSRAFTPVPANSADANPTGYIVSSHHNAFPENQIALWHIEMQADGSPLLFGDGDIAVNPFSPPPDAPQPGTPFLIDTGDARLTQAVAITDPGVPGQAVWTQHSVAGGGGSVVRWYEIAPGTRTLRQQGEVRSDSDFIFNGAISPSKNGNDAAVFYNRTNASSFPSLGAQSRTSATPPGAMDPGELLLGTSASAQLDFSCNPPPGRSCRWGDYAGATPDPVTAGMVWGTGELLGPSAGGSANWTTRNYGVTT